VSFNVKMFLKYIFRRALLGSTTTCENSSLIVLKIEIRRNQRGIIKLLHTLVESLHPPHLRWRQYGSFLTARNVTVYGRCGPNESFWWLRKHYVCIGENTAGILGDAETDPEGLGCCPLGKGSKVNFFSLKVAFLGEFWTAFWKCGDSLH